MTFRGMRRYLPVLAISAVATLSCSHDGTPTAPAAAPLFDGGHATGEQQSSLHTAGLLFCHPLPYAADTETIGPAGGTLHIGPHQLTFPAGALDTTVTIIGVAPRDTIRYVQLYPRGLEFEGAWLTLNYAGCQSSPGARAHQIAYTDNAFDILYFVDSYDQPRTGKVTAEIEHFSRYAVGW